VPRWLFKRGLACIVVLLFDTALAAEPVRLNSLVSEILQANSPAAPIKFDRGADGWIFVRESGDATLRVDNRAVKASAPREFICFVTNGQHTLEFQGHAGKVSVRAIPELMHCGLGFDPVIASYGSYDLEFLAKDILPNITTIVVPQNKQLAAPLIEDWHARGKRFIAEVGVDSQAKTADEHAAFWNGLYEKSPFLDGILINEFIVNRPVVEWAVLDVDRLARMDAERKQYDAFDAAFPKLRKDKIQYAYIGGSGKKLNQEIIGTNFIRTILKTGNRVALERYLHEMSSEQGSQEALQLFIDGIKDWASKEPGVVPQMVITFGLFSMPPGGLNKQPNVDYHVWMDRQMNLISNHPMFAGVAGINWWTSLLADEETVRFVGKLYRHYGLEGKTNLYTSDPLFLTHLQNADFEKGTNSWTLKSGQPGSIEARSFPRYGRIEGRYMGLGRPADPEHIGDTFLWMRRSARGPNTFSQNIKDLKPGRLYSLKMFSCDYNDLVKPMAKKKEEAEPFVGIVDIEGVEMDEKRSFTEMYSSNPEPKIPIWITYHWKVFRATNTTARLSISDWPIAPDTDTEFGQEQAFNFLELQPYHE